MGTWVDGEMGLYFPADSLELLRPQSQAEPGIERLEAEPPSHWQRRWRQCLRWWFHRQSLGTSQHHDRP